jgi:hypothetical protein
VADAVLGVGPTDPGLDALAVDQDDPEPALGQAGRRAAFASRVWRVTRHLADCAAHAESEARRVLAFHPMNGLRVISTSLGTT